MAVRGRHTTCYHEVEEPRSRHLLLAGIKTFNRAAALLIALWALLLLGHGVHRWALQSPCFEVKKIVLCGQALLSEEEVLALADIEPRCNLFRVKAGAIRDRLVGHQYIRLARVERCWPSTLRLRIEERKPLACLAGERGCIDEEGVLLPLRSADRGSPLPVLTGIEEAGAAYGASLGAEKVRWAISFLKAAEGICREAPLELTAVDVTDLTAPLVHVRGTEAPIRVNGTDCCSRLRPIPWILADLERRGAVAEYIDIRFDRQIVVKPNWPGSGGRSGMSADLGRDGGGPSPPAGG